jgi:hypothetical protein
MKYEGGVICPWVANGSVQFRLPEQAGTGLLQNMHLDAVGLQDYLSSKQRGGSAHWKMR